MRKLALVFALAVLAPSLALAWLAMRSLNAQQIAFERQQVLLYEGVCVGLIKDLANSLSELQIDLGRHVETLLSDHEPLEVARHFDERILKLWSLAEVGFTVSVEGNIYAPSLFAREPAKRFRLENDLFLSNQQSVQVYWRHSKETLADPKFRKVAPQKESNPESGKVSKIAPGEVSFGELVGDGTQGVVARYLQNRLHLLMWYRSPASPHLIFGAQLRLEELVNHFQSRIRVESPFDDDICVALLDDNGKPAARSHPGFLGDWSRPFVAVEVGQILPHWEIAAYLLDPKRFSHSTRLLAWSFGSLVVLLVLAIASGSALIVADLRRQTRLARQKTDFVSNVSHELKTPLTSIRMFSELLSEGRVADETTRRSYLAIITTEVARLTRLLNNVLDFARIERGEKQYQFQRLDLREVVRSVVDAYTPHLRASGFQFTLQLPGVALPVQGDSDALHQIVVNLLSNAEKYSTSRKEIAVDAQHHPATASAEIRVLDRGIGVTPGNEERIFDQFYREHDSLSSGIQGSGLGLTLARQMARAHGGDVHFEPREGGGSIFVIRLPLIRDELDGVET